MRLFVCSLLNADNQRCYQQVIGELVKRHRTLLRPTPPDSAHLTYAFLPDAPQALLPQLIERVTRLAARYEPVEITLGEPFVLTGGREARLICAAVEGGEASLGRLAASLSKELDSAMTPLGCRRTKSLHVTLARFRKGTSLSQTRAVQQDLTARSLRTCDTVERLDVVESALTPQGPIYKTLHRIRLATHRDVPNA